MKPTKLLLRLERKHSNYKNKLKNFQNICGNSHDWQIPLKFMLRSVKRNGCFPQRRTCFCRILADANREASGGSQTKANSVLLRNHTVPW